jgi:hypothetical protein
VEWRSFHVHYFDDQDDLIAHAVGPLLERLAGDVPQAYHVRHWRRGPHLRLNFRADTATFERVVRPAVAEVVGGYLAARPSTAVLDEQRLLPLHAALAEVEEDPGPRSPFRPDNTIHEEPYDRRAHAVGGEQAADLLADFYLATQPIALSMARDVARGGQRLTPCFDLLVATAHIGVSGGLASGFPSFRSHAEAFLAGAGARREVWDRGYAARREQLVARVGEVVATVDGAADTAPLARAWVEALRPVQRRAEQLLADGVVTFNDPTLPTPGPDGSAFHRELLRGPAYTPEIRESVWFRSHRLLLNYLYLHLTRHGIRPMDRFLLCHLVANAVEDRLGVTAVDLVSGRVSR